MDATLLTFAVVVFAAVITPGPTVLLALSNGSRFGFAHACFGMAGAVLSDLVLICAAAFGLGALLMTSSILFGIVKWIGVLYLAWLGLRMLRNSSGPCGALAPSPTAANGVVKSRRAVFGKSFFVAVTNPKGYLFCAALLPQFVDTSAPIAGQYLALAAVFIGIDLLVMAVYAALGARAIRALRHGGALWVDRICGTVLLGLAGILAVHRRA
ncbi:Threonine/homoserine/homoserine lactone efflux protein [Poseidonocella pacifica]|uniref:Threonine/homoserine/homoserine lactone efflux protein n=1 Tax=Poseidonocella pacifica TaxID=871651 RepID=A0A1I0VWB5_9RHOB|nr:LysE family translocator [Poseidonocella pacifica]SFA80735.1 Threonine/homoserine/homoserine lactone efflux protein [Poseidonocella pacifica]